MIATAKTLNLKVFRTDERTEDLIGLTLREAFDLHKRPHLSAKATIDDYRSFLSQWERLTTDPDVALIDDELCRLFIDERKRQQVAPETINGNVRCFRSIMNAIGPRTGNKPAAELLERLPLMLKVDARGERRKPLRVVPRREILAWLGALFAVSPKFSATSRVSGPLLFRSLLVTVLATGLRIGDVHRLTWDHFTTETDCPGDDHYHNADGWLFVTNGKTGKNQLIPVPPFLRVHLDALAACSPPRCGRLLLPIAGASSDARRKRVDEYRRITQEHAGIDSPYGMHDLRATAGQWWEHARAGCGRLILNHASQSVTDRFYLSPVPQLLDAVDRLDVPAELLKTE